MAGYAASARLQGAAPQFAFADQHAHNPASRAATDTHLGPQSVADGTVVDQLDLVGRPVDEMVADWLASVGESWSQLTFFLFDPESWR